MKIDIVGSFLPGEELIESRPLRDSGAMSAAEYRALEDKAIAAMVEKQLDHGLTEVTSGELRRRYWDKDFYFGLGGVRRERLDSGRVYQEVETLSDLVRFSAPVEYNPGHPFFADFEYLRDCVAGRADCRQTIPSPADLYLDLFIETDGMLGRVYPYGNLAADLARAWNDTIRRFHELGCRNIMLDDTAFGRLSEPALADELLTRGHDVARLENELLALVNASLAGLPADMRKGVYLSSGATIVPRWIDSPDQIMSKALSTLDTDYFILPFNPRHTDDLQVLAAIAAPKTVSLGLVVAHSPFGENDREITEAMRAACGIIDPERLRLTTRTGFKLSSYLAHGLSEPDQWRKLTHLISLATGAPAFA